MSALAEAHIEGQRRIRVRTAATVAAAWDGLGKWDDEDVGRWLSTVLPVVAGAERASSALTNAFLARALGRRPVGVALDRVTGAAVRNGTPPADIYRRPLVTVWTALAEGVPWVDAVARGQTRASASAQTDVQLTSRATLREIGNADPGIHGFERVPDGDACELCLIASTQRYHTDQLMPIHDRCGCSVEPILEPTGQIINRDRYEALAAGDDAAVRATIQEHGELGPVLTNADHHFTDAAELAA